MQHLRVKGYETKEIMLYQPRLLYQTSAGNKAKTDTEETLVEMGAINLGLHRTIKNSKIFAFFRNLAGLYLLAYCLKKEYSFLAISHQEIFCIYLYCC